MARYDYECSECGHEFEVIHSMNEKPEVLCDECEGPTKKIITACGIVIRNSNARGRVVDHAHRTEEARQDLAENFGIEKVAPVGGSTFSEVYNDVKRRGSEVREKMQKKRENTENTRVSKSRNWKNRAMRRAPERSKVIRDKRAQEKAAKRAITL